MADQLDTERIDADIRARYPYPLAATFHRAYYATPDLDEAHEHLLDLFEVMLKYLASLTLAHYFADKLNDPNINRTLLNLERPSLGHWQAWLRDILELYRRERRPLLVPELATFYGKKSGGELLEAYGALRQIMADRMGYEGGRNVATVSPQQFFELLGTYRNRLAHGVRPSRYDRERVAGILMPGLRALLYEMAFVADYRLVFVREVTVDFDPNSPGQYRFAHWITYLTGLAPGASPKPKVIEAGPARARELYLLDKNADFQPLLSLHPFLIFRHCESCNREQAFVLNQSKESALDYISYQCTHHFSPSEYLDYVRTMLSGIREGGGQRAGTDHQAGRGSPAGAGTTVQPPAGDDTAGRVAALEAQLEAERKAREEAERRVVEEAERKAREEAEHKRREEAEQTAKEEAARLAKEEAERQSQVELDRRKRVKARLARLNVAELDQLLQPMGMSYAALPGTNRDAKVGNLISRFERGGDVERLVQAIGDLEERLARKRAELEEAERLAAEKAAREDARRKEAERLAREKAAREEAERRKTIGQGPIAAGGQAWGSDTRPLAGGQWPDGGTTANLGGFDPAATRGFGTGGGAQVVPAPQPKARRGAGSYLVPLALFAILAAVAVGYLYVSGSLPGFGQRGSSGPRVLAGHATQVESVAFSPDGATLATGSADYAIGLWDVAGGSLRNVIEGHDSAVLDVAFSPDGQILASASLDTEIRLWNAADGRPLRTLEGHDSAATSLAFSPDGQLLATGSEDAAVRVWRVSDGELLRTMSGHLSAVNAIAFSPDGQTLASASDDYSVRIWRAADGALLFKLDGHLGAVNTVAYSPDGLTIASGADDRSVFVWQASDGRQIEEIGRMPGPVWSLAWAPGGGALAVACHDYDVVTLVRPDGTALRDLEGHTGQVNGVAFSRDGRLLASISDDKSVRLWDTALTGVATVVAGRPPTPRAEAQPTGTPLSNSLARHLRTLEGHGGLVHSVAFAPDGQTLASGGEDFTVRLWDAADGTLLRTKGGLSAPIQSVAFAPDGKSLVLADVFNVQIWQLESDDLVLGFEHTDPVNAVAYSPDGNTVAVAGADGAVVLLGTETGSQQTLLAGSAVRSVAFSPDGTLVAAGTVNGLVHLWSADDGAALKTMQHKDTVWTVAFSHDGEFIASGSQDRTAILWHTSDDPTVVTLEHLQGVSGVAFSPDGRLLATAAGEATVSLWRLAGGTVQKAGEVNHGRAGSVAFSPDSQLLATGSADATIRLWAIAP